MLESHPKGQKHMIVLHLLSNTSSTKIHFLFHFLTPFHFCLRRCYINTTHLLREVLEEYPEALVHGEEATETFKEITVSGLRLDDCAETVLEVDLNANNLLRQLTPSSTKVFSHLQTLENGTALT